MCVHIYCIYIIYSNEHIFVLFYHYYYYYYYYYHCIISISYYEQINKYLFVVILLFVGLLRQVDGVVNNFGSDVYSVVDRTINLSSG